MKIGLIVHSRTGNTASVAERLRELLSEGGHDAVMERLDLRVTMEGTRKEIRFGDLPDPRKYEAVVFGAPVEGFALCPEMAAFLVRIGPLRDLPVALLVTEFFPFRWMGGSQAIRKMARLCRAGGAVLLGSSVVNWSPEARREERIREAVETIAAAISAAR